VSPTRLRRLPRCSRTVLTGQDGIIDEPTSDFDPRRGIRAPAGTVVGDVAADRTLPALLVRSVGGSGSGCRR
jgi:hypothetical protein